MSISDWHKAEGKNRKARRSIEVGTSEENPVYTLRIMPSKPGPKCSKTQKAYLRESLAPIDRRVEDFASRVKGGYSPSMAASLCGFRWLDWRPLLIKDPRFSKVYSEYRHARNESRGWG